jgi:hypothetical protein
MRRWCARFAGRRMRKTTQLQTRKRQAALLLHAQKTQILRSFVVEFAFFPVEFLEGKSQQTVQCLTFFNVIRLIFYKNPVFPHSAVGPLRRVQHSFCHIKVYDILQVSDGSTQSGPRRRREGWLCHL